MPSLKDLLDRPVVWKDWDQDQDLLAFLADLQANILKGHGRDFTANVFLSFAGMKPGAIRSLLEKLSYLTTSALDQLRSAEAFKLTGVSGGRIVCVFLSRGAYEKLEAPAGQTPADPAFQGGMRQRGGLPEITFGGGITVAGLNDPPPADWEKAGPWAPAHASPDAMILIADDDEDKVTAGAQAVQRIINGSGAVQLGIDRGLAQRRKQTGGDPKGEGIEHFGYVDGRSQPLFLAEDLAKESQAHWNATFKPSQFIVADPAGCTPVSAGSYFVYRKLEQDVKAFKEDEEALDKAFAKPIGERAGALVVGRYEDGTPVSLGVDPTAGNPINDFNYQGAAGKLCPARAHIRKLNPRTIPDDDFERRRIMARRGITYGLRAPRDDDGDFSDEPTGGVGLIFMAYMADISEQFEFTQAAWANNAAFPNPGAGVDVVLSQRPNPAGGSEIQWDDERSGQTASFDFKTRVKLVGGDYFYAPPVSFLQRG